MRNLEDCPIFSSSNKSIVALVAVNLIWAGTYPATAIALQGMSPLVIILTRLAFGGIILSPFLRNIQWNLHRLVVSIGFGILGFSLPLYLQTQGLKYSSPAIAAMSIALEPLATTAISTLFLKEHLTASKKYAIGIAIFGAWALSGFARPGHLGFIYGDFLLIFSVLSFGIYNSFSSTLSKVFTPTGATSATLLGGFITLVPLWLIHPTLPSRLPISSIAALGYLIIIATAFAYFLWLFAVQHVSISMASLFLYLQPIIGVLLSVILTHTPLNLSFFIGSVAVLTAIYLGRDHAPASRLNLSDPSI